MSLRAAPLLGGSDALESGLLHRTLMGVHRHDSDGSDDLGRHAQRAQGGVGQANVEWVASGIVLILLAFGVALVGTAGEFRTEQLAFRPEAIETASRLLGAWVVVASVYSYALFARLAQVDQAALNRQIAEAPRDAYHTPGRPSSRKEEIPMILNRVLQLPRAVSSRCWPALQRLGRV